MIDLIADPYAVLEKPGISRPGYLEPMTDPVFGTTVTRITGDPGTPIVNTDDQTIGTWGTAARHWYSKVQPWNADESLIYLYFNEGGNPTGGLLLDGQSYEPIKFLVLPTRRVRWHPANPDLMIYAVNSEIGYYNVQTGTKTILREFTDYILSMAFLGEGEVSADGSMMAVYAEKRSEGNAPCVFAYDMVNDIVYPEKAVGSFSLDGKVYDCLDWVSISPSGQYIVIYWTNVFVEVYDLNMNLVARLEWPMGHMDIGYDTNGREMAVGYSANWYVCHNGTDLVTSPLKGQLAGAYLDNGSAAQLGYGDDYAISHVSTRNLDRPGWAYVWVQRGTMQDEIVAHMVDGSYGVQRFGHLHNNEVDYRSEAHPVPSPDGRRVLFASNWDEASGRPVGAYVIDARQ